MNYDAFIGKEYEPYSATVDEGRIRQFAASVGLTDAVYHDLQAAQSAGYAAIPAPPTFAFTIALDAGQLFNITEDMGIPATRTVHGTQGFSYHRPIVAGDVLRGRQKIARLYEKKGGALVFIDVENRLEDADGEPVCDVLSTVVVRAG